MSQTVKRPNGLLWIPLVFLLRIYAHLKGHKIIVTDKITAPSILLSNHTSFHDFIYTTVAGFPHRISYLAADKMFYDPVLGVFLRLARAIPKCLFQTDFKSVRAAFSILRQNGVVGIFPEGQISGIGTSLRPPFSIAKLLKKANADVFCVQHRNAYFANPPWTKKRFAGRVETVVVKTINKEDFDTLSEEAIFEKVEKALYFNSTKYNEERKLKYRLNDVSNLENLIYRCPACENNGLISRKTHLHCPRCGNDLVYDETGRLGGYGQYDLYHAQEIALRDEIDGNPDFQLMSLVKLESYRGNRVKQVGEGTLVLTRTKYRYEGTIDNQQVTMEFMTKKIPYLPSDIGRNIQIYDNYQLYQFVFEDKKQPTMFVIAGETMYNRIHGLL